MHYLLSLGKSLPMHICNPCMYWSSENVVDLSVEFSQNCTYDLSEGKPYLENTCYIIFYSALLNNSNWISIDKAKEEITVYY